jgi:hypothetical protein
MKCSTPSMILQSSRTIVSRRALVAIALMMMGAHACHQSSPQPVLPDRIGPFTAGPLTLQGGASQRTYATRDARITVTLARFPMTAEQYDDWVRTSVAGYPQAALDVPAGAGNGFYQCTGDPRPSCDLLIQLRAGVHVEIRGNGTSSRADVDAIARGLRLRAMSSPPN